MSDKNKPTVPKFRQPKVVAGKPPVIRGSRQPLTEIKVVPLEKMKIPDPANKPPTGKTNTSKNER